MENAQDNMVSMGGGNVAVEPFGSDKGYFGTIIILVKLYNHNYSTFEYS